ncbi:hypothetical protein Mycch_1027 [Mycolicibacterium chubuense NBB4]|uniref:Uncharacterized protein n=1 Tax=Mycolicibacterium chubuense (strain NBB4) TaxID=710421 RepID=I4BEY0_MYCCN|nr:hypothetical protein [Mycolicibacterium chubuense]AFM15837.1 hypothetical protein Mycch_1027 [Mycolicibacterium chubuense NBB4]
MTETPEVGAQVCPVCGAPIDAAHHQRRRRWFRSYPAVVSAVVVLAVLIVATIIAVTMASRPAVQEGLGPADRVALQAWWQSAYPHVTELQSAVDDSRKALQSLNGPVLAAACQRMHDAAAVDVAAHVPAPDPDLTAELNAAAQDAHNAAHECLAVLQHSPNNYDAEFVSNLDQTDRHLTAAVGIVNRNLTEQSGWVAPGRK